MTPIVPKEIEDYASALSAMESDVCRLIREETYRTQEAPQMLVGPLEAAFLKVMMPEKEIKKPNLMACCANAKLPLKQCMTPERLEPFDCDFRMSIVSGSASRV